MAIQWPCRIASSQGDGGWREWAGKQGCCAMLGLHGQCPAQHHRALFHPQSSAASQSRLSPPPSHSPGHPHRLHRVLALLACGDVLHPLGEPPVGRLLTGPLSCWPVAALRKEPSAPGARLSPGPGRIHGRSCCHEQSCGERIFREGQPWGRAWGSSPGCLKLLSLPFSLPLSLPLSLPFSLSIPIPLP